MFLHALTENTFKKGVKNYLTTHQFKAVSDNDLFDALQHAAVEDNTLPSNLSVAQIMSTWTRQRGFPLLTVRRDYVFGTIELIQNRYLTYPQDTTKRSALYWIPYNFMTAQDTNYDNTKADNWLGSRKTRIRPTASKNFTNNDFVLFNNGQTCYYRVLYDEKNYKLIAKALNSSVGDKFLVTTKAQLIDDAKNFVDTGRLNISIYLNLLQYLPRERSYLPFVAATRGISQISRLYAENENYSALEVRTKFLSL